MNLDLSRNWCISGGADGADLAWGARASECQHEVIHFSFAHHHTKAPPDSRVILTRDQLMTADPHCAAANRCLHRRFPSRSQYATNLVRRDWFQVAESQACYAVSSFSNLHIQRTIPLGTVLGGLHLDGGTAWAVTMFIARHEGRACSCFVFDQDKCHWFQWHGDGWECIYQPPRPEGIWAGIGTRRLKPIGRLAISTLLDVRRTPSTTS